MTVDIQKQVGGFALRAEFETEGGTMGLLGASGCGKSMTLRCIAGVEKPDRGRIVLNGRTLFDAQKGINLPPQQRRVGLLFQNGALFPNMTVRENILCGLRGEKDRRVRELCARKMMALLGIEHLAERKPAQLSGGEAQRAALARMLVTRPELLLLDEPFSALDAHLRLQLQTQIHGLLRNYGRDTLLVTHDRDEAYRLCEGLAIMDEGRVLACRETKALFADPGSRRAAMLTGCKNIAPAHRDGAFTIAVPEWGVTLRTEKPVERGLCAVGVRAHGFSAEADDNAFPVSFEEELEEPFAWILRFRFAGQPRRSEPLWWRVPKERHPQTLPRTLGVAPKQVLALYA